MTGTEPRQAGPSPAKTGAEPRRAGPGDTTTGAEPMTSRTTAAGGVGR